MKRSFTAAPRASRSSGKTAETSAIVDSQAATASGGGADVNLLPLDVQALPRTFGDYELLAEIARGGMGVVYRARQISLDRIVALKMILGGSWASKTELQRFQTEAAAAAHLAHPHIVPIYELGQLEGQPYFTMQLVEGGSLADHISEFAGDPRPAARLICQVALAVHHAHQRGILHRDLKPGNILLDGNGGAHVTDFGLAKWVESDEGLTRTGAVIGTLMYMPPEQASPGPGRLTTAADIYSVGAILYELLAGRAPFRGSTAQSTLRSLLEEDPQSLRSCNRFVDRDLETICLKCLEKDPARRYGSAEALAHDLQRWLAHEPIQARPATTFEHMVKWIRRRPSTAALTAVITLSVLLVMGLLGWHRAQLQGALLRSRRLLYAAQLNLAQQALGEGNVEYTLRLLDAQRPGIGTGEAQDLRGFEWYYLYGQCQRDYALRGHQGPVRDVAFAADAGLLASGGGDGTVRLWDVRAGTLRTVLRGHSGPVRSLSFGPGGRLLASGSNDGTVVLWEVRRGRQVAVLTNAPGGPPGDPPGGPGEGRARSVHAVAFSPDGRMLAAGSDADDTVVLWDLSERAQGPAAGADAGGGPVGADAAAPRAADTGPADGTLEVRATPRALLRAPNEEVLSLAFSPDGQRLGTGTADGMVRLWDVQTAAVLRAVAYHTGGVFSVRFSPDGRLVLAGTAGGAAHLLRGDTFEEVGRIPQQSGHVFAVGFSPDGRTFATATETGAVKLWDTATQGERRRLRTPPGAVWGLDFSPDGALLAVAAGDGTVRVFSGAGEPLLPPHGEAAAAPPPQQDLVGPSAPGGTGGPAGIVTALAFAEGGRTLYSAGMDGAVRRWDVRSGAALGALEAGVRLFGLAVSPAGDLVVAAGEDHSVRWWRGGKIPQAQPPLTGHQGPVRGVALSPDGHLLASASDDQTVRLWDLPGGGLRTVLRGHGHFVHTVAFSPDGRMLASGGHNGTTRLWEVHSGRELLALRGHTGAVLAMIFSADGRTLYTTGADWTVRVWDTGSGEERAAYQGHTNRVFGLALSASGDTLASVSQDGTLRIWDLQTGQERARFRGPHSPLYNREGDKEDENPGAAGLRAVALSPPGDSGDQTGGGTLATAGDGAVTLWRGAAQ